MAGRRKLLLGAFVVALALTAGSMADAKGYRHYLSLRQSVTALQERNAMVRRHNEGLLAEIEALRKDPRALERAAREELGFIRPGEIVLNVE
jgi:cell division protein FtsB